jgi:hypothetical protein
MDIPVHFFGSFVFLLVGLVWAKMPHIFPSETPPLLHEAGSFFNHHMVICSGLSSQGM